MKTHILQGRRICFFFFLISVLGISYNANAVQNDPNVVLDTFWYLHSLTINNESMIPPSNEEVQNIPFFFEGDDPKELPFILTSVCNEIIAGGDVLSDVIIFFEANPLPLINCQLQENIDFDEIYFNFLMSATEFPYELLIEGDTLQLTLIAPNGDQAVYRNEVLAIEEVIPVTFTIYPNPVQDFLYINAPDVFIQEVSVYNSLGEEVKKVSFQEDTIDVKGLSNGVYFAVITSSQGNIVKKFIVQ